MLAKMQSRFERYKLPVESSCGRARLLPSLAMARQEPRPPRKSKSAARPKAGPLVLKLG